jgi:hypothetical protein
VKKIALSMLTRRLVGMQNSLIRTRNRWRVAIGDGKFSSI